MRFIVRCFAYVLGTAFVLVVALLLNEYSPLKLGFDVHTLFSSYTDADESISQVEPVLSSDARLAAAQNANPDTVAWLTVPGTNIDGPVQQGPDNEYYLRRDALGAYSNEGCFYADFECTFSPLSTNTIIYGHTFTGPRQDPSIGFGQLQQFLDPKFAGQNKTIFLSVQDKMLTFEIVSVGLADATTDQVSILAEPSTEQLASLVSLANERNVLEWKNVLKPGDKLLTLSTCTNNKEERLLIVAQLTALQEDVKNAD